MWGIIIMVSARIWPLPLRMKPVMSVRDSPCGCMDACLTEDFPHAEMHVGLHVKCPLLLSNFNQNWNVLTNSSKTA
jgi:hypothetical protein